MASTDIEVCSNALVQLGDSPINSFDDGSGQNGNRRGRACKTLWPTVRDKVLRSHPWNCARKQASLTPVSESPEFDFSYQFDLPSDWLRCISINKRDAWDNKPFYKIHGKRILTNQKQVFLTYIYKNVDVSSYDAQLVDVLELAMAARLSIAVTGKATTKELYEGLFRDALRDARNTDGQEESTDYFDDNLILDVRDGGSSLNHRLPDY